MKINNMFICISILLSCHSSLPNQLAAAESNKSVPPVLGQEKTSKIPSLKLELEMASPKVIYRKLAFLQLRFFNRGDFPIEFSLNDSLGFLDGDFLLWWTWDGEERYDGFRNSFQKTDFILAPKESLTLKMPPKLFFIGKHKISVKYQDKTNGWLEIESNVVEIEVKDGPVDRADLQNLEEKYRMIADGMMFESYVKKPDHRDVIQKTLLIGSPHSVGVLKRYLVHEQKPDLRSRVVEILGMIADKERAARIGYVRDTSAADLVIERIDKESDAAVKTALLKIIGKFFDVLDQPQREKLEKTVLALLTHQDAGVRVQAALTLLELFPAQRPAVETALAKPEFADEAGRKAIAEPLAR